MNLPLILILEDDPERLRRFHAVLEAMDPTPRTLVWDHAPRMIQDLPKHLPQASLISLDNDMDLSESPAEAGEGLDVAHWLARAHPSCPVIIHSSNFPKSQAIEWALEEGGWACFRVAPLGADWIEAHWSIVVEDLLSGEGEREA